MTSRQYRIDSVANRLVDRGIDTTALDFDAAVRSQEIALFGSRSSLEGRYGSLPRSDRQDRLFISAVRARIQEIRLARVSSSIQARLNTVEG